VSFGQRLKRAVVRSPWMGGWVRRCLRRLLRWVPFPVTAEARIMAWMVRCTQGGTVEFCNSDGIRFRLDLREYVQARVYCYDYYEIDCVRATKNLMTAGATVVDVGANIGQYSLLAASLVGKAGRVVAFEPDPDIACHLREHIAMNGFGIEVQQYALGDKDGRQGFYPAGWAGNQGQGSLLPAESDRSGIRKSQSVDVEVKRLDDVMQAMAIGYIDFLKIDVEGYELRVLQGGEKLLQAGNIAAMMVELSPQNLGQSGDSVESLVGYLAGYGYDPFVADRKGRLLPMSLPVRADVNAFFILGGLAVE